MYLKSTLPEAETKADPFSLTALVAWLRTKPENETYCFFDNGNCLIGQYLKAIGIHEPRVGGDYWRTVSPYEQHDLPESWQTVAVRHPYTFGAALHRAEDLLRGTP